MSDGGGRPVQQVDVVVAVPVRLYREGLADALRSCTGIRVLGNAEDCAHMLSIVDATHPDVVLMDITMPCALNGMKAVCARSDAKVIAVAVDEPVAAIHTYIEAGASGYVTSDSSIDGVEAVIRSVVRGELLCSPRVAATLMRRLAHHAAAGADVSASHLTRREEDVLRLIRDGLSNKEIAARLHIAEATVKNHVHRLLEKLDARTRAQAAARTRLLV